MSSNREIQQRAGKYLITSQELLTRLPDGVARVFLRRGQIPDQGTGRYSIPNEHARVATEKEVKK